MQAKAEIDPVYTRRETAQRLRISLRTLTRMERAKKMPPRIRLSDRIYGYRQSAIENYLSARTAGGGGYCDVEDGDLPEHFAGRP